MARSSTTFAKGHTPTSTRGPSKKLAMLNAIEKKFAGGTQEFCEHLLDVGLSGGNDGSAVPALLSECLKRIEPPLKPNGVTIQLDMPEGATHAEKAEVIFNAVSDGVITLESGQMMIGIIKDTIQIIESTELAKRLGDIEKLLAAR